MPLRTELELGRSNFERNWKRTRDDVRRGAREMKRETAGVGQSLASSFAGAGRGALAAVGAGGGLFGLAAVVKSSLQYGDDIADLSQKLNESAEVLQRVDFAGRQAASVGVEQISKAMLKLEDNLGDITNTRVADALDRIGMSAEDLVGLPLDQKLIALGAAFQEARATGVGVADMTELIGRQAGELIPLLNLSQEAMEDLFSTAPALSDESIQKMAQLNDQFDAMVMKSKGFVAQQVDRTAEWLKIAKDVVTTLSFDEAFVRAGERATESEQALMSREEARKAQSEAIEQSRQQVEQQKAEAIAARELADTLSEIQQIKDAIGQLDLDTLPETERIEALRQKLEDLYKEAVPETSIVSPDMRGLQSMAASAEAEFERFGQNGEEMTAAFRFLEEARQIQAEIAEAEGKQMEELARLRADVARQGFDLLSPEEQAQRLRSQLSDSLGIDIRKAADIESGLERLRRDVNRARESGDAEAERAALEQLADAQGQAADFRRAAEGLDEAVADAPAQQVGSFGQLFNQIFGRDPMAQQIESLRQIEDRARDQVDKLDRILVKMDEPPPRDVFDDFEG